MDLVALRVAITGEVASKSEAVPSLADPWGGGHEPSIRITRQQ